MLGSLAVTVADVVLVVLGLRVVVVVVSSSGVVDVFSSSEVVVNSIASVVSKSGVVVVVFRPRLLVVDLTKSSDDVVVDDSFSLSDQVLLTKIPKNQKTNFYRELVVIIYKFWC